MPSGVYCPPGTKPDPMQFAHAAYKERIPYAKEYWLSHDGKVSVVSLPRRSIISRSHLDLDRTRPRENTFA